MIKQSEKNKKWEKSDYVRTGIWFFVHTLIILALCYLILCIKKEFDMQRIREFFGTIDAIRKTVFLSVAIIFTSVVIYLYFYYENKDFIYETKNVNLLFFIFEISIILTYFADYFMSVYARPFALLGLLTLLLIGRKPAMFLNAMFSILVFIIDLLSTGFVGDFNAYFSLLVGVIIGMIAVYLVSGEESRFHIFVIGFIIALPVILIALFFEFGNLPESLVKIFLHGALSGLFSVAFTTVLLPFFEKGFNVVTDYRLSELCEHKEPLIKAMIENAPGTFNHAVIVSTLAEACATAIGENPLLARACAYYHDVGKLKQPEFFSENQSEYNMHQDLTPELSTDIIRSHAKDGAELIKKYKLPEVLSDVAVQHHGTLPIRFFYNKALKFTDGELDVEDYSYKGPKPQSKIAAIVMIADGCEAKVRTLADRSHEKVDEAVREIIEERMDLEQFDECELTMHEITLIRKAITNSLAGVYHDRVKYPKIKIGKKK